MLTQVVETLAADVYVMWNRLVSRQETLGIGHEEIEALARLGMGWLG